MYRKHLTWLSRKLGLGKIVLCTKLVLFYLIYQLSNCILYKSSSNPIWFADILVWSTPTGSLQKEVNLLLVQLAVWVLFL